MTQKLPADRSSCPQCARRTHAATVRSQFLSVVRGRAKTPTSLRTSGPQAKPQSTHRLFLRGKDELFNELSAISQTISQPGPPIHGWEAKPAWAALNSNPAPPVSVALKIRSATCPPPCTGRDGKRACRPRGARNRPPPQGVQAQVLGSGLARQECGRQRHPARHP